MNRLEQVWPLPGQGTITLVITAAEPFPEVVWREDLPDLAKSIDIVRMHLGGDL